MKMTGSAEVGWWVRFGGALRPNRSLSAPILC